MCIMLRISKRITFAVFKIDKTAQSESIEQSENEGFQAFANVILKML